MLKYLPGCLACSAAPPSIATSPSVRWLNTDLVMISVELVHHLFFEMVGALGQRHLAGDLVVLCGSLRSHLTPPFHDCGSAHWPGCPEAYTEIGAPATLESQCISYAKTGIMDARQRTHFGAGTGSGRNAAHRNPRRVARLRHAGRPGHRRRQASFNIEQSEFLCIVGPSGCGKSTLLNIIAGFLAPTGGEIRIGGKAVTGYGQDRGVVFQDFAQLFPWRTALGNVTFGLEMKGVGKDEREEIARKQLALVKLEKFANSYPHHLSGGMQQRVAIARALAYNPAVLLMDEPFAALDALTRDDMQRLLADVWRETRKTVIYVTHNVAEAVYLADRVVVMTPHPGTREDRGADRAAAAARSAQRRISRLSEAAAAPARTGSAR